MTKSILVVDDEEDIRALIQLGLEMQAGWKVLNSNSGEEAILIAESQQPDAILLDLMMPDMDGKTTLKKLKDNPQTKQIPVILMTAKSKSSVEESFSDLDVAAIFTKPLRPLNLAQQISEVISLS
ncbi:response regulator with CheY-like receiver, AAA-type ATPase, and DNA-binding domains [Rivularia sp. PCC 7116]|uniref:response regulator n=1 Tax=Rivularia sp. PCC 7116 TaxID=373994 RepID=UPI00029EFFD2|nr:response regulator [Rivularia sp. PCC 7116]AFY54591.1 response regulator with CheY-like receiver, AAA-type ATPase, and DNA-binding domains [Rivularia sp. PCC 7116]